MSNIIHLGIVENIGEAITKRRKLLGLTQEQLASYSELSRKSLYGIESGTANPTIQQIEKVFKVLGLEIGIKATNA